MSTVRSASASRRCAASKKTSASASSGVDAGMDSALNADVGACVFGDVVPNVNATDTAVDKPVGDSPIGPLRNLFESDDLPSVIEIKATVANSPTTAKSSSVKPRSPSPTTKASAISPSPFRGRIEKPAAGSCPEPINTLHKYLLT